MDHPARRTDELHKGRLSLCGARYFVTLVTCRREPCLADPAAAQDMLDVLRNWHARNDGLVLAATVMPDHVHVLFELGQKLTAGQCIGRWKSEIRKRLGYTHEWQRDFWEHRLRPGDSVEEYALYIFLNPYRARLIRPGAAWLWWWAPGPEKFLFTAALDERGGPPAEWIAWPGERLEQLGIGE